MHPRHLIGDEEMLVLQAWQACRAGDMGGGGVLPEDWMRQPLCLLEAFRVLDAADAALKPKVTPHG